MLPKLDTEVIIFCSVQLFLGGLLVFRRVLVPRVRCVLMPVATLAARPSCSRHSAATPAEGPAAETPAPAPAAPKEGSGHAVAAPAAAAPVGSTRSQVASTASDPSEGSEAANARGGGKPSSRVYANIAKHARVMKQQSPTWLKLHAGVYAKVGPVEAQHEWARQDEFRDSFKSSVFVSHIRSEANFFNCNGQDEAQLPPAYPPDRELRSFSRLGLYRLLFTPLVRENLIDAVGWALWSGAAGSLWAWCVLRGKGAAWIESVGESANEVSRVFNFFTTFLLTGCLSYVVSRWQEWLVNSHALQGRLHDVGLLVGGCVCDPDNTEVKARVFRLYRLLNVVHAMTYQSVNPLLPKGLDGFHRLGLLTLSEVCALEPAANKKRDVVLTWVSRELQSMMKQGHMDTHSAFPIMEALRELRALCAKHHDMFVRNQPNTWYAVMYLIVDYQVGLAALGYPFSLLQVESFDDSDTWVRLLQPWTIFGVFLVASSYWGALAMVKLLHNPFTAEHDAINTDALLGSTERCLFSQLRVPFMNSNTQPEPCVNAEAEGDEVAILPPSESFKMRKGIASVIRANRLANGVRKGSRKRTRLFGSLLGAPAVSRPASMVEEASRKQTRRIIGSLAFVRRSGSCSGGPRTTTTSVKSAGAPASPKYVI